MVDSVTDHFSQDLRINFLIGFRKENLRLLFIADDAGGFLEKISPFQGYRHIGDDGIDCFAVFFCQRKNCFQNLRFHVNLDDDTVCAGDDFIPMFKEGIVDGIEIRTFGNRADHITFVVKDSQPGSEAIFNPADIFGVDFVMLQFFQYIGAGTALIDYADVGGLQFYIGDILDYVPAHASMHLNHPSRVPSGGDILAVRVPLNIYHYSTYYNDSHTFSHGLPPFSFNDIAQRNGSQRFTRKVGTFENEKMMLK